MVRDLVGDVAQADVDHGRRVAGELEHAHRLDALGYILLAAADRQHQRIDQQVGQVHLQLHRPRDQRLQSNVDPLVGADGNAADAHGQGNKLRAELLGHQRHVLQALLLSRGGVDDARHLGDFQRGLDGGQVGGVQAERHGRDFLHGFYQPGQDLMAHLLLRADVQVQRNRAMAHLLHSQLLEIRAIAVGNRFLDFGRNDMDVLADDLDGHGMLLFQGL